MSSLGLQPGSFPSDFRDNLWVGLGLGLGIGLNFRTEMLFQIC